VPAAYALSRSGFKSSRRIALWILATRMAPPIAFTIPFFLAYRHLGLSDTLVGLIIVYLTFNLALVIWMMQPFFDGVPRELEEAAWIDGCGVWEAFCRVTLPLSAPGLAATAVICFILSWNDFFYALVLTRTNASTAPVAIVNFIQYTGWEWGRIAAAGTLVMLPVVVFSMLVRNYLVRGLAAGGVKE
jgi:multiple sugar transport system permease protein